jgi:hypothetical protein
VQPGDQIGNYEVLAQIGKGGMGEVYRARDKNLARDVAIKVLPAALARDPDRIARFEHEAKVLAALNHPNIAIIHGMEECPNKARAIVMELVEGPTLQDRLKRGALPLKEALGIARQIADALEAAHEKGVVHRDVKPANVKVREDGTVKVLDFGLATAVQASAREPGGGANSPTLTLGATEAGMILGTAAYMAPEQAEGKPVDRRADIWSFGVVLWEMVTCKRLFHADTVPLTLADVLRAPVDFTQLPEATLAAVRDLLKRCLDRGGKNRLRDIGEARVAIGRYLANPESGSETPAQAESLPHARSRVAWAVAGFFALAAGGLGYVAYRHTSEEPARVIKVSLLPPEKATYVTVSVPAVSPDGRRLAITLKNGDGKNGLWIRDLDSLSARLLPGTDDAILPFWSPDSRTVAFFAGGKLKRIDVAGGPALTLCDAPIGRGGTWSQNVIIVFGPNVLGPLVRVPAAGGTPAPVTELDKGSGETVHSWPWFLPDGRHFLYLASSFATDAGALYVGDLDSKDKRKVAPINSNAVYVSPGYLLFARERTLMAQPFDASALRTTGDAVPIAEQLETSSRVLA